jgi:hypothetical protein
MRSIRTYGVTLLSAALAFGTGACKQSNPTTTQPPTPTPTSIMKVDGDTQTATVGSALGTSLVVQVNDQNGAAMNGVSVSFAVTAGGGTVSAASANTNASGQASVDWTLGPEAGAQTVRASVTSNTSINTDFSATADPDAPATLALESGDNQTGLVDNPLTNAIEAKVEDQFGNGIVGHSVTFSTPDGGSIAPTVATTDANGIASAVWTLGPGTGAQTAQADATGLSGSPVTFDAIGTTLFVTSITPDPLVEGGTATVTGTGFDLTAINNTVTVDGQAATVTAATLTALTVTLPTLDCQPARDVDISVSVALETSNTLNQRLNPASPLSMAVGEQQVITDPNGFCWQFLPDGTGGDSYLVGVSATAEVDAVMPFSLMAADGAATSPPPLVTAPDLIPDFRSWETMLTPYEQQVLEDEETRLRTEMRLRQWEQDNAHRLDRPTLFDSPEAAAVVPIVGDLIDFKVPDITGNLCTSFTTITTEVKKVGTWGIVVVDQDNYPNDPFTDADLQSFSDDFDSDIHQVLVDNFGAPGDMDANGGRVFMVLTKEVNEFPGAAGFVTNADLATVASCASSDEGEIFYGFVPDPLNTSGNGARTRTSVVANMPALIAHEVTHTIQFGRRPGGANMASWEAEGQADLAKELLGLSQRGDFLNLDYGASKITDPNDALYTQRFSRLGRYFGWDLGSGTIPETPHNCSLFSYKDPTLSLQCTSAFFYGASWSFHRWVLDQYGPTYTGGVAQLEQDWIGANPTLSGRANVEALLGADFDDLFVQWAAMLYVDGRVPGLPTALQMTSWDLFDIYANAFQPELSLVPVPNQYQAFAEANSVRGGSTFYTVVTAAAGPRGSLAIRLRDAADATLPTTMSPRFWIVRLQ